MDDYVERCIQQIYVLSYNPESLAICCLDGTLLHILFYYSTVNFNQKLYGL